MENYKVAIGKRMQARRKELHLTQEQMAEKLDVSVKHYGGVERGMAGLSIENFIEVSDILGMSLDYLIKGEPENDDRMPNRIQEIFIECPKQNRQHLIQLLEIASKFWTTKE